MAVTKTQSTDSSPVPSDFGPRTSVSITGIKSPLSVAYFSPESPDFSTDVFESWQGFAHGKGMAISELDVTVNNESLSPKTPKPPEAMVMPIDNTSVEVIQGQFEIEQRRTDLSMAGPKPSLPLETSNLTPALTVNPAPKPAAKTSRITYLADVVKDNEERRKKDQAD